jgi:hypothetical protein
MYKQTRDKVLPAVSTPTLRHGFIQPPQTDVFGCGVHCHGIVRLRVYSFTELFVSDLFGLHTSMSGGRMKP